MDPLLTLFLNQMENYNLGLYTKLIDNYNRSDSFEINCEDLNSYRDTIRLFTTVLNSQGWDTEVVYDGNSAIFNITPFFISKL